jgi:hypothetical protein
LGGPAGQVGGALGQIGGALSHLLFQRPAVLLQFARGCSQARQRFS